MAMNVNPPPEQLRGYEQPLRLLGLNAAQIASVRGRLAHYVLMFKAYGLLISCVAFGWFVYGFAHGLLRWEKLESALLGLVAAPLLLMIEAYNVATTMGVPGLHLRRWAARLVVVTFVFGGVLGQAADRLKDDVDATVATNVLARVQALTTSPQFSADLKAAQDDLARANERIDRQAKLHDTKQQLSANQAAALAEEKMECEGATSKDGRTRLNGCGPKARGWAAEAGRLSRESDALAQQIQSMGDTGAAKAQAQARLDALKQRIEAQAQREYGGSGARLAALFQAARQDWGVVFVLAFTLGVYMLPDFIAWLALGHTPGGRKGPEGSFAILKELDRKQTDRGLDLFAHRTMHGGSADLPELEVKLASAPSAAPAGARPRAQAGAPATAGAGNAGAPPGAAAPGPARGPAAGAAPAQPGGRRRDEPPLEEVA